MVMVMVRWLSTHSVPESLGPGSGLGKSTIVIWKRCCLLRGEGVLHIFIQQEQGEVERGHRVQRGSRIPGQNSEGMERECISIMRRGREGGGSS
jgi:hypothetical protein